MTEIVGWVSAIAAVVGVVVAIVALIVNRTPKPPITRLEALYRKLALDACDIIDLANLPEDDRHIATRNLELRRLYVALRLRREIRAWEEPDDKTLAALEGRRAPRWGEAGWRNDEEKDRVSLGERLGEAGRLVVLGDPGAGKSTLLRWLATAYLLRLEDDPDFKDLPDIASLPKPKQATPGSAAFQAASLKNADKMSALPAGGWLPILVRCRDLPLEVDTLEAMLLHTLKKSQLPEAECAPLGELLRARLESGAALLLVDALDEITEPAARARFSEQLVKIHLAYPAAPMVVTSRIVGYREMGYRIRSGFEHLTVADLSKDDKDAFARRWCNLTEVGDRREAACAELIRDIHSADRIERLTGNPMLLTTMALIKRKIGRLPQRRVDLYEKAVEVLLNWRSQLDEPLDPREALPQLEYLAHALCADGIQQIREDEILERLREMRAAYPNIYSLQQHSPEAFLHLLEARTGLLIQSGHVRHDGRSMPVYEFRHLTFQEYLAGLALVQGHYRGWDTGRTLAEIVAPLAGQVGEGREFGDTAVVENWREALRLCVAACNDSEVEEVLAAILRPLPGETGTERARAVLAVLCLADEPNVSEQLAGEVLRQLAAQVGERDGWGNARTSLDAAAMEVARSRWKEILGDCLLDEFQQREGVTRGRSGGLYAMVREIQVPSEEDEFAHWLTEETLRLAHCDEREAIGIALTVLRLAYLGRDCRVPALTDGLIQRLAGGAALAHGAAGALYWMNDGYQAKSRKNRWGFIPAQQKQLIAATARPDCDSEALRYLSVIFRNERMTGAVEALLAQLANNHPARTRRAMVLALGKIGDPKAIDALVARLEDTEENTDVRQVAAIALGNIGKEPALDALRTALRDTVEAVRRAALGGLAQGCEEEIDRRLLSENLYGFGPWLDPARPIDATRMEEAARRLDKTPEEIRRHYEALAARFGLTLAA
uniref:HEAT repeat-containing protein n=1 Tax=Candidatus Kentrum sp. UNK TaxID=2126344 RepID=A0A451A588_9GAMM|nr:MAG: HEAT repeat-containing protein [Candidatus Kentron sp. UNK]VFK69810.1 MAG: HEAT repeat-containing protein [Candidatus Kentron sp. UNK]